MYKRLARQIKILLFSLMSAQQFLNDGFRTNTSLGGMTKPYRDERSYQAIVQEQCTRNPCLMNLSHFLSDPTKYQHACRICAIDFHEHITEPTVRRNIAQDHLRHETQTESFKSEKRTLQGRIIIIEDLTQEVLSLLGSELDIDPLFFSLHLHTVRRASSRFQTPDEATLPSRLLGRNFINVSYHKCVMSEDNVPGKGKFLRNANVDRKLVFIRSTKIGLAQHCASIIRVKKAEGPWLAIMLVDPPVDQVLRREEGHNDPCDKVILATRPFLGAYEDFREPLSLSKAKHNASSSENSLYSCTEMEKPVFRECGMFEDLQEYWADQRPACFDREDPTIQSLAYYTLKIVAAEWVKYVAVMQHCLKKHEYNHESLPGLSLDKFDEDLRELQSWRRRTIISQGKLRYILRFLRDDDTVPQSRAWERELGWLKGDLEHINNNIEIVGRRLESMLPVVMSFVQITDARRSFAETADISRLTVLALIFVPLTFVSSLFSMNPANLPGESKFWIYFAVAIPLTGIVVLVARPPRALRRLASKGLPDRTEHISRKSSREYRAPGDVNRVRTDTFA